MTLQDRLDELRGLDTSNLGSWPYWVRVSATILAAILIICLGSWFLVRPKLSTLHEHQAREKHLKHEFRIKENKVANLDAYKSQLHQMQRSFANLLRQLPSKTQEANLLNDISEARVASGLEQELFKPQAEVQKNFYAELPIQIIVVGTYHEMSEFVSRVAALSRIVTLQDVDIQPVKHKGAPSGELRMHVLAKTYRYIGDQVAPASGKSKKSHHGGRK